jgi:hypothetical protein
VDTVAPAPAARPFEAGPDSGWGPSTGAPAAAPPAPKARSATPDGPPEGGPPPGYKIGRDGKPKKLRGKAKRIHKARTRPPSRILNYYDVNGPRIRLGFLWFLTLGAAIAAETGTDLPVLALVYGTAAGFGGWQAAREWRKRTDGGPVQWASAAIGAGIGLAAGLSAGAVGLAVLGSIGLAMAAGLTDERSRKAYPANVGLTLQCGVFVGIAAAAPALTWRVEPGAAIALILLVSAYEVGDYVVGSGSLNAFEGPVAGIAAVIAVMMPMYAVQLPPINPDTALTYALIIAIGCPIGQLVGSAVLPWSDAAAPAVRRLDSLMVAGPAWLIAVWLENGLL